MTERFLEWITYNDLVDLLFSGLSITVVLIVIAGWIIWRASITVFRTTLKIALAIATVGLCVAWYMDYWPWG